MVADPNQAIYEWRDADVNQLERVAQRLVNRALTGNWRSSRKICAFAGTLRDGPPDHAVNDPNDDGDPIHLLSYPSRLDQAIGERFAAVVDSYGISRTEAVVLAHRANTAAHVVGAGAKRTSSILAAFARAGHRLQDSRLSPIERQRELAVVDRLLLRFVGADTAGWTTRDAIDRHGVDETWLRSAAMELVVHAGEVVPDGGGWCVPVERAVGSVVIVVVEESSVGVLALLFAGPGADVGPFLEEGAVEAFDFAVGLGPVGAGFLDLRAGAFAGFVPGAAAVAAAVVGDDPLAGDAEFAEPGVGARPELCGCFAAFVVEVLAVGQAGAVVEGGVQVAASDSRLWRPAWAPGRARGRASRRREGWRAAS